MPTKEKIFNCLIPSIPSRLCLGQLKRRVKLSILLFLLFPSLTFLPLFFRPGSICPPLGRRTEGGGGGGGTVKKTETRHYFSSFYLLLLLCSRFSRSQCSFAFRPSLFSRALTDGREGGGGKEAEMENKHYFFAKRGRVAVAVFSLSLSFCSKNRRRNFRNSSHLVSPSLHRALEVPLPHYGSKVGLRPHMSVTSN